MMNKKQTKHTRLNKNVNIKIAPSDGKQVDFLAQNTSHSETTITDKSHNAHKDSTPQNNDQSNLNKIDNSIEEVLARQTLLTHPLTGCLKEDQKLGCSAAESALRRYIMSNPVLFDPKNLSGVIKNIGGNVRSQCLIHWFLHSDEIWFDGVLLPNKQAQILFENYQKGNQDAEAIHQQILQNFTFHCLDDKIKTESNTKLASKTYESSKGLNEKSINEAHEDAHNVRMHKVVPPMYSDEFYIDFFSPIHWQDPLELLGEQTEEDFLHNNLAVRAFASAMEHQLSTLNMSQEQMTSIIVSAVHQMYPQYVKNVHNVAVHLVHHAFYKYQSKVRSTGNPITSTSPIMNVPTNLRADFLALILETIDLAKNATGIGLDILQKEQLDRQKKIFEKIYRALKKYYSQAYPELFDSKTEPVARANERLKYLHYPLKFKAAPIFDSKI